MKRILSTLTAFISCMLVMGQTYSDKLVAMAEDGDPESMRMLADCYFAGNGTAQNYEEAVTWYKKAAKKHDCAAMNRLGDMHRDGKGLP